MPNSSSKLDALCRILLKEKDDGFLDGAVIGGLDRFLQRWAEELEPSLGKLSSYSVLTPPQREKWARAVLERSGDGTSTAATAPSGRGQQRTAPRRSTARKGPVARASLDDGVDRLRGIATTTLAKLRRLGVERVRDLVYLFPSRHNDFSSICKVSELEFGKEQTVLVNVWEASETGYGKRRSTQAILGDDTGNVRAIWFNNPWIAKTLRPGASVVISGKVGAYRGNFVFESPEYELIEGQEELVHTGRLVPVYPSVTGLPQRTLRRAVKRALDIGIAQLVEFLPADTRHRIGLMGLQNAVAEMHYPGGDPDFRAARYRLAFDELLTLQLAVLKRKREWQQDDEGIPLTVDSAPLEDFLDSLPFALTGAQSRSLQEIVGDMEQARPMSRLLQGDVGSGKTVVAAAALLVAAINGCQGALMAPTEILAEQHFLSLSRLFAGAAHPAVGEHLISVPADTFGSPLTIGLLIGSLPRKVKTDLQERLAEGSIDIVIGTQALIQDEVALPNLALAVVDEQHRFGVMQRASLRDKGKRPHLLAMSATPIPRSLALTVYGDLDVSVIDEMPPGRQRIRTRFVESEKRTAAYHFVRKEVEQGRQSFIVCPLIDGSEVVQTRAATEEYERLSTTVFPDLKLGLLHGRMALREKELAMDQFQQGDLDILVSTPVIEVGIDVPNATVMVVDGAERFGLAQLHQFRGRVGRGQHQSYCLLLADFPGEDARERLKIVERVHDGFELAEEDLRIRGPGDYLGTRQSGLPDLKVARITDHEILTLARREATRLLDSDPELSSEDNALLGERMRDLRAALAAEMS